MTFKQAVKATKDVENCYETGLKAFGAYSSRISVADTSKLEGSVNIDNCTTAKYPNANRWDYGLSYKGEVFFVEVHSAITSEVSTVLRKFQWLKAWLHGSAPNINNMKAKTKNPFVWIQSKNFQIPKNTPQYRAAVKEGLLPVRKLELN